MTDSDKLTRRSALAGMGGLAVAVPLLAACGSSATESAPSSAPSTGTPSATPARGAGKATPALTTTKDVPVGGGVILAQQGIVVTQPEAGTIKAFSTICTHQGCPVTRITGGNIECPCHGSLFSIKDGSVVQGPATTPLRPIAVTVTKSGDVTTHA